MKEKNKNPLKRVFLLLFGNNKKQQFGSFLIFSALALLFFIYYPLVQLFIPQNQVEVRSPNRISIPKISTVAPIIWNVDPFNDAEYHEALTHGVAHAKGTSLPGQPGTVYIFAHSSDFPWRLTRYNVIFFRLGELVRGDQIVVTRDGHDYIYKVREARKVWPTEIKYLTESKQNQLILQTCWPIGTSLMRLLVFADPA